MLNLTRDLLAIRNSERAMRWGNLTCIDTGGDDVLAFVREYHNGQGGEAVTCVFNLTETAAAWPKAVKPTGTVLTNINGAVAGDPLPPFGAVFLRG